MKPYFHNYRSLVCLCFVILAHIVVISVLLIKNTSLNTTPPPQHLLYVSIIQPPNSPTFLPKPRPRKIKPLNLAIHSPPTSPTIIEPITSSTDFPSKSPTNNAPTLDLDTLRANAVQYELGRTRSAAELQKEKNRRQLNIETQLEEGATKAQRTDCRTAHAGTGLLAPLFIATDILNDKGCKF